MKRGGSIMRCTGLAWVLAAVLTACGSGGGGDEPDAAGDVLPEPDAADDAVEDVVDEPPVDVVVEDVATEASSSGTFLMLTYNVAGLPDSLSSSHPSEYTPQISPLLNAYDLVVVQEDFWYHHLLVEDVTHAYRSVPMVESPTLTDMGDGLNRFSVFPIEGHERVTWETCNGTIDCSNDCLTPKGFSYARHQLSSGVLLAVYNLHMDAGSCDGDFAARGVQVDQLIADLNGRSAGQAVIVAGDTNLSDGRSQDMDMLDRLMTDAGLTDACRSLSCGQEELDRVLLRSSGTLTLEALSWAIATEFVDPSGHDLSDHPAVRVEISWESL
jgi:endonuclease/exonuclease/phosphatase family metal-dependent hydrolase